MMPPGWIKLGYTAKIGQDVAKTEEAKQKSLIKDIKEVEDVPLKATISSEKK